MGRIVLPVKEESNGDSRSKGVSPTYIIKRKATVCEELSQSHLVVVGSLRSAWGATWGGAVYYAKATSPGNFGRMIHKAAHYPNHRTAC